MRLSSAFVPPCDKGFIWCTSSAAVSLPFCLHISHKGCADMYLSRIAFHARPYLFFTSGERSYFSYRLASSLACSSQNRLSVRRGQPGNEHGRFGLYGVDKLPFLHRKSPCRNITRKGFFMYTIFILPLYRNKMCFQVAFSGLHTFFHKSFLRSQELFRVDGATILDHKTFRLQYSPGNESKGNAFQVSYGNLSARLCL